MPDQNSATNPPSPNSRLADNEAASFVDEMRYLLQRSTVEQQQERLEEETPSTYQIDRKRKKSLDPCTLVVLREAGVSGYQGDSDAEQELTIELANAEFLAKQRLEQAPSTTTCSEQKLDQSRSRSGKPTESDQQEDDELDRELDPENLANASGYVKRESKPGNASDALATLMSALSTSTGNSKSHHLPSQVNSSASYSSTSVPFVLSNGGATGDFPMPPRLSAAARIANQLPPPLTETPQPLTNQRVKKQPNVLSKRVSHAANKADTKGGSKVSKQLKAALAGNRNNRRLDELADLLPTDSDSDGDVIIGDTGPSLEPAPRNREQVEQRQKEARQQASTAHARKQASDQQARQDQTAKSNQRKVAAQARCQKQERRR